MDDFVKRFEQALLSLDRIAARHVLQECQEILSPIQFAEEVVAPALELVGRGWDEGSVALSQVYISSRICEELVNELLPPAAAQRKSQPKMAIVSLADYHLLGKRIVFSILRASGFDLLDYGQMGQDQLIRHVQMDGIRLLLISTLMLPSALQVKEVRSKFDHMQSEVKLLVGGAPFLMDNNLWREVGADGMGRTASEAVEMVTQLMENIS